jgi:hypothetical protein
MLCVAKPDVNPRALFFGASVSTLSMNLHFRAEDHKIFTSMDKGWNQLIINSIFDHDIEVIIYYMFPVFFKFV